MPSPLTSPQASRLLWRLQGPLAESIFVVWNWDTQDPPREPFATQNLTGNISWHAISQESLTEPKIKTISGEWIEWHLRHASPGDDDCVYGELLDDLHYESECSSSEGAEEDDNGDEVELLRCCDTDQPKRALPLVIEASNTESITIHDYVSALHPWLIGLRQDIARADNMMGDRKSEEYEHLVVYITNPQDLSIMDERRLLGCRYTCPPVQMPMSQEHAYLPSNVLTLDVPLFRNIPRAGGDSV
ncbi:hypothetical protein CGCA056_v002950 [Colletotrichum aenigma]|uniref:uncharacterized protein n=1 Tax=Colletotrichum aenigma TaxID=1215731 RepID=UPI001872E2BD|nr:uncharacterized protein CGCA056_v002950 [Colletotrichum aenigma]KAF5526494.1 hypothetical protein CGCA056_v002950 [Colletotrichum aenigma]